ncbi:MAG: SPASM domain-containing protein [Acidobacteriota bacterium]
MSIVTTLRTHLPSRQLPRAILRRHFRDRLFSSVEIETYSRCNIKCPTCPVATDPRPPVKLSEEAWRGIILDLERLDFSGMLSPHFYNEPFLDDRLFGFLSFARERLPRATIEVFTNSTRLTPELFRTFSPIVDAFRITVDQPMIRKALDKLVSRLTEAERAKLSTRSIQLNGLTNRGGTVVIQGTTMTAPTSCRLPMDYLVINASGEVLLCYNDYHATVSYGNINTERLSQIWFSPRFLNDRVDIYRGVFQHRVCQVCESNEC